MALKILNHIFESIRKVEKLRGGDINEVFRVESRDKLYAVKLNKLNDFPDMIKHESEGLRLLSSKGLIQTPNVIYCVEIEDQQALVLEFIDSSNQSNDFWKVFGENLALQHNLSAEHFGLKSNNYIGSLVQQNQVCTNWDEFLINQRLLPMIKGAVDSSEINYSESKKFDSFFNL